MKLRYVAFVGLLLATSCAAPTTFIKEPGEEAETLVIGRILLDCQRTRTGAVPIGKYTYNVRLEFEDVATGKILKVSTVDPHGFFYLLEPPTRQLRLIRLAYSQGFAQPDIHKKLSNKELNRQMHQEASTSMKFKRPATYAIQGGKVNNLGRIVWIADLNEGSHECTFNKEHDETRAAFVDHYPKSLWIQATWLNVRGE